MTNIKYKDLIEKHKKAITAEHSKFTEFGEMELIDEIVKSIDYKEFLFDHKTGFMVFRLSTMDEVRSLPYKIMQELREYGRPYYDLKVVSSLNNIECSARIMRKNLDNLLVENTYAFQSQFMAIVRREAGVSCMSKIDRSVVKLYREDIITFEQMTKSVGSC